MTREEEVAARLMEPVLLMTREEELAARLMGPIPWNPKQAWTDPLTIRFEVTCPVCDVQHVISKKITEKTTKAGEDFILRCDVCKCVYFICRGNYSSSS